ncbi:MAG: M10 family metallopeptidase C-terminal domain-containing protein [Hyphomonas sp.]
MAFSTMDPFETVPSFSWHAFSHLSTAPHSVLLDASAETISVKGPVFALSGGGDIVGNSVNDAGNVNVGDTITGNLETADDDDWYAVQLTAGQRYLVSLTGTGTDPLDDPYLEILDANANIVQFNDDTNSSLNSLAYFTPDTSGTYYLNARSYRSDTQPGSTGEYELAIEAAAPIEEWSTDEIANFLTNGYWEQRRWDINDLTLTYNIDALTAGAQTLAEAALQAWADITPISFVQTAGTANLTFDDSELGEAHATPTLSDAVDGYLIISSAEINIGSDWNGGNTSLDSYTYQTYLHEIGHAIGLGHAGNYNGGAEFGQDNLYSNDSWATTVMSYFDQEEAGSGSERFVLGPQAADIVAIQSLYGVNPNGTRPGDTTYGFNSTESDVNDWSQFVVVDASGTYLRPPSMAIYDTGGIDTIDLSGFGADQYLNMLEGESSSLGQRASVTQPVYNNVITIMDGTIIENAIGGIGDDTIITNAADNTLTGGLGADQFVFTTNSGDDIITDFAISTDTIDLTALSQQAGESVFANRQDAASGTLLSFSGTTILLQGVTSSTLTSANFAFGEAAASGTPTNGNDTLHGDNTANSIAALGGADTVYGHSGNDSLDGGTGNDRLYGGADNDTLIGRDGNDAIYGDAGIDFLTAGNGDDRLFGGDGNDKLDGGNGNDRLYGGDGIDVLSGRHGNDLLDGGEGNDTLVGHDGTDTLIGRDGNDKLIGGNGDDVLSGGNDNDILSGENDDDTLDGGAGNDTLLGGTGNDNLLGRTGNDKLNGGAGNDTLSGNDGTDHLDGSAGNDKAYGGNGDDTVVGRDGNDGLYGDDGNDFLSGGNGNDYLNGGENNDKLDGGNGNDRLYGGTGADILAGRVGDDLLDGGAGDDTLAGHDGVDTLVGREGNDKLFGGADNDLLSGGDGDDSLKGDSGNDKLDGGNGNDRLVGGSGTDILLGRAGDDVLNAGTGNDTLAGNDGNDYLDGSGGDDIVYGGNGVDTVVGRDGADTLYGDAGEDFLSAGNGDDYLSGGADNDKLDGGNGNDDLSGGAGDDILAGRAGNDTLDGSIGNDILAGHAGDDHLFGGEGDDVLVGGGDNDTFQFATDTSNGIDTISDFTIGEDIIDLQGSAFSSFADVSAAMTSSGSDTVISFGANGSVTLSNISMASLSASDFTFASAAELPSPKAPLMETPITDSFDFSNLSALPEAETQMTELTPLTVDFEPTRTALAQSTDILIDDVQDDWNFTQGWEFDAL